MKAKFITAFGESKTIKDWSQDSRCVVPYEAFRGRLKHGQDPELALTEPFQKTVVGRDIKVGDKLHRYTIEKIYSINEGGQNKTYVEGKCDCGTINPRIRLTALIQGTTKSCGCWKSEVKSKECSKRNYKHGQAERGNYSELYTKWVRMKFNTGKDICPEWQTFEGFELWAESNGYIDGLHIYLLDETKPYHPSNCMWHSKGYSKERLHQTWIDIIMRCENQNNEEYHCYGGRGITICTEWRKSYLIFKLWAWKNGYNDTLTIERKDNDGNYCPENCTWIPLEEQGKNKKPPYYYMRDYEDHRKNKRGTS